MKSIYLIVGLVCSLVISAQQLAFPGAEGFGKYAMGGRSGSVYHVTNLNDSGTGSFRTAVSQSNRIVVFDVAGVIKINSGIVVRSNIYIAGQTAPGEGITIYGNRVSFSGANNTICRHMRFRMGVIGDSGKDAMGISNGKDMIFDHVSVSWGRDETFSINWDGKGSEPENITIQNSIVSQGLLLHSAGGLIQTNKGVSLYRNVYIDNSTRNNKVKGVNQYVNNIVYNWKSGAYIMGGDSEGSSYANVVSNYFILGPEEGGRPIGSGNSKFNIYADDNWFDNNLDAVLNGYEIPRSEYGGGPTFKETRFDYPVLPTLSANVLLDSLLPGAGACLPYRDLADYYVVNQLKSLGLEGELISNESTLPIGAPTSWKLWSGTSRIDTDKDGMPDDWEDANGTNKSVNDAMVSAANGYVNIENYINSIDAGWSQAFLRAPLNLSAKSSTSSTITFSWLDYTRDEDGFIIERLVGSDYVEVGRVAKDVDTYTLDGLDAEEEGIFRVYAYTASLISDYAPITAKSRPVEVPVIDPETFVPDLTWKGQVNNTWDKSTQNWVDEAALSSAFLDNSAVLFDNTKVEDQTITVSEEMPIGAMMVNSSNHFIFDGAGYFSGSGSMNKTGKGTLTLGANNTFTGATVIWEGILEASKLANGGFPSSLGSASKYAFNLVMKGGKLDYTGGSVATDREMTLDETGEFSVSSSSATVTMNGTMNGVGGFIKSGAGNLKLKNKVGNKYEGETTVAGGVLSINMNNATRVENVIGASNVVNLAGGTLQTVSGQSSGYEEYDFKIMVPEGKTGGFYPYRNCYIKSKVSGSGILNFTIPYVREYIQGDWSEFTGTVVAKGINSSSDGSQFLLDNTVGIPNAVVELSGNAKIINWATTGSMTFGGLRGARGTYLGCASKNTDGTKMTWTVGGMGTDETFNGIINNDCSADKHYGVTSIVKEGTGVWRLTGSNIYSGTTTVTGGTLIVNGTQSGTGTVTVKDGAKLAGKGRLRGATIVETDGTLEPGDSSISNFFMGRLVLNEGCQVNMDINKIASTQDYITCGGTVKYGGTLNLSVDGTLVDGDEFVLFTGTGHSGNFENIIPAEPGEGLHWEFEDGILRVALGATPTSDTKLNSFNVYPNPITSNVHIQLNENYTDVRLKVLNLNGSVLVQKSFSDKELNLDMSALPKGIYLFYLEGNGVSFRIEKVVKE